MLFYITQHCIYHLPSIIYIIVKLLYGKVDTNPR